jgi:hypothetical protein
MHIGRKGTPEPYFFFKGVIDDVRVYNRALTDGETDALFRERGVGGGRRTRHRRTGSCGARVMPGGLRGRC